MAVINDPSYMTKLNNVLDRKLGASWRYDEEATTSHGLANHTVAIRVGPKLYFAKSFSNPTAKQREFNALAFLSTKGFYVPEVIATDTNFLLLSSVGHPLPKLSGIEGQLLEIGRSLRRLHNLDASIMSAPAFFGSQADSLNGRILESFKLMPKRRSLLHGDITWENIVQANSGEIVLIDFEEAALGHPLVDLSIAVVECCWDPLNVDHFEPALAGIISGYNDHSISDWLLIRSQETHMSACELAAEELLSWSRANHQDQLSRKYIAFIQYLQKGNGNR